MSLSTRNARASAVQLLAWGILAPPDGAGDLTLRDAQHAVHGYGGVVWIDVVPPAHDWTAIVVVGQRPLTVKAPAGRSLTVTAGERELTVVALPAEERR